MPKGNKAKTRLGRNELIASVLVLVASLGGLYFSSRDTFVPTATINQHEFRLQIADDSAERKLGLSGQDALDNDEAMLFIYSTSDMYGIWMKDMKFSIDIIWMDENQRVVHIEENISPSTYPESFIPSVDARYVLEVYTGQVEAKGIGLGDEVKLSI